MKHCNFNEFPQVGKCLQKGNKDGNDLCPRPDKTTRSFYTMVRISP